MKTTTFLLTIMCSLFFVTVKAQQPPCSDFEGSNNPYGFGWSTVNCHIQSWGTNTLDQSTALRIKDGANGSIIQNLHMFDNLGSSFSGGCLCFDYKVEDDGLSQTVLSVRPEIYLSLDDMFIVFRAFTTVTENDPVIRVCAPLVEATRSGTLASNADGFWLNPNGYPTPVFNTILVNNDKIYFKLDFHDDTSERIMIDNICVHPSSCHNCNPDFKLEKTIMSSNTANPKYIANLVLDNFIPGWQYYVDWGDGNVQMFNSPSISHNYTNAGGSQTYSVCVTAVDYGAEQANKCYNCMDICFSETYEVRNPINAGR